MGLFLSGVIGAIVNILYYLAGLETLNSMYMLAPAIETGNKFTNFLFSGYAIAAYMILVTYLFIITCEYVKSHKHNKLQEAWWLFLCTIINKS